MTIFFWEITLKETKMDNHVYTMLEDSTFQWCDYAPHGMFNIKQFEVKTLQTNYGPSILLIVIDISFLVSI